MFMFIQRTAPPENVKLVDQGPKWRAGIRWAFICWAAEDRWFDIVHQEGPFNTRQEARNAAIVWAKEFADPETLAKFFKREDFINK